MQVSIENLTGLERRMTIGVPAEKIESKVQSRLQEAARNFQMKGFRKGKVPIKVIKNRFGQGVRQEVLGEVMSESYQEAVSKENVKPAGQPRIEAKSLEEGKDFEFTATFEVYPEIRLGDFSGIRVEKKSAEITEQDIDVMIDTLRKQKITFEETDRPSENEDQLNIDFHGTVDGEDFQGGQASGSSLVLGSNRMIPGFEEGLLGLSKGEDVTLTLSFPEQYHSADLAGKTAEFKVKVNSVSAPVLPELDDDFFASFDVREGGLETFRKEVAANMGRELKKAIRSNVKNQIIEALFKLHEVEVPRALVGQEITALRQQALQQFAGNQNIDESQLPDGMFVQQAQRRVSLALVMGEIIRQHELKADPKHVRTLVEEIAESYEEPGEVITWYYSDKNNLAAVESMAMEDAVIDLVLETANVNIIEAPYEEALKPSTGTDAEDTENDTGIAESAEAETETQDKTE